MTPYYERPEWAGWLASIREMPDDDVRRLACADWLEENGQGERAEFIRVQVELSKWEKLSLQNHYTNALRDIQKSLPRLQRSDIDRISPKAWDEGNRRHQEYQARWESLRRREFNLIADHGRRWAGWDVFRVLPAPLSSPLPAGKDEVEFSRGSVTRVSGPLLALHGGGECGRCGGNGRIAPAWRPGHGWRAMERCPSCEGEPGRTPGVLGPLLRREPVTAAGIVVTDREPQERLAGGFGYYVAEQANLLYRPHWLPMSFKGTAVDGKLFPTADAARLALGEALFRIHSPKTQEVLT